MALNVSLLKKKSRSIALLEAKRTPADPAPSGAGAGGSPPDNPSDPANPGDDPGNKERKEETIEISKDARELAEEISAIPLANLPGGLTSSENRLTSLEISNVLRDIAGMFGIGEKAALGAVSEMIRRGGTNANTPDSFSIDVIDTDNTTTTSIEKRDVVRVITKVFGGKKSIRNLEEGLAESIVLSGITLADRGVSRPGDLARKINNRLTYKKEPALTPKEMVGCASYSQWLPYLDSMCGSERVTQLLAENLDPVNLGESYSKRGAKKRKIRSKSQL